MGKGDLKKPLVADFESNIPQNYNAGQSAIQAPEQHKFSLNGEEGDNISEIEEVLDKEIQDNDEENKEYEEYIKNAPSRMEKQSIIGEDIKWRKICFNDNDQLLTPGQNFCSNEIHTSKYTWYSFIPKNLFFQFSKIANLYFLIMMCFQMIPQISISQGRPTILLPLGFVVLVSMIKDILEDSKRHASDNRENASKVL